MLLNSALCFRGCTTSRLWTGRRSPPAVLGVPSSRNIQTFSKAFPKSCVKLRILPLPSFPPEKIDRLLKQGKRIKKGVSLKTFTRTAAENLPAFSRLVSKKYLDYSDIANEIYARRIDHHHGWYSGVSTQRYNVRNGQKKNTFTEFGQPHLRGQRLQQLWRELSLIELDKKVASSGASAAAETPSSQLQHFNKGLAKAVVQSCGSRLTFERKLNALELPSTVENRQLENEGLQVLNYRKKLIKTQLKHIT